MTKNDKELIAQAEATGYTEWFDIDDLMKKADSDEARERMRVIRTKKFHEEEYHAGLL